MANQKFFPEVKMTRTSLLRPSLHNARTHSKKQIRQIADSIDAFGFVAPIQIGRDRTVIAGHGRLAAAKLLGVREVPVIEVAHLSPTEIRALMLADNKIAENAGWDPELLAIELVELAESLPELGFDLTITGFEMPEIDRRFADRQEPAAQPADTVPPLMKVAVSRPGDVWILGPHRVACGDARDRSVYQRLMAGSVATMALTDPPYNVRINGHVKGRSRQGAFREFGMGVGEQSSAEFTAFLSDCFRLAAAHSSDGSIHFVFMDWRHSAEILAAGGMVYDAFKNLCVWAKTTPGQGTFYRSQHELVFVFKKGTAPHINNFELGQHGRTRSNVWTYPGVSNFPNAQGAEIAEHPTVKPVALVIDAIKDCSKRGDIVLDPFLGSGTTLLAAERTGRRGYGIELDPLYVDLTIRRWIGLTKRDAILEATGRTFEEEEAERGIAAGDPFAVRNAEAIEDIRPPRQALPRKTRRAV